MRRSHSHIATTFALAMLGAVILAMPTASTAAPASSQALFDWAEVVPTGTPPAPRREHCAIYDPVLDHMIVYGGATSASVNDRSTWQLEWTPTPHWTQLFPTLSPPAARGMAAVYDPVRRRMLVIGGDLGASSLTNEVWSLSLDNPTTWQKVVTAGTAPDPRMFTIAVYDPSGDRVLLSTGYPQFNDTWTLSLSDPPTWNIVTGITGTPPAGRWGSTGIYDSPGQRFILFSGYPSNLPDTWSLNFAGPTTWQQQIIFPNQPPARVAATSIYDPIGKSMLLYGGLAGSNNSPDTWSLALDGTLAWNKLTTAGTLPPTRRFQTAVYRSLARQMVIFGGYDDAGLTFRNDTWSLQLLASAGTPVVSGFAPLGGEVGDVVTISGIHLSTTTSVQFNGVEAVFSISSDAGLLTQVPPGATTGPIHVTTSQGSATTATNFIVGVDPVITAAVPDSGRVGDSVQLLGSHFTTATSVRFGSNGSASFSVVSDGVITVTLDSLATTGPVHVTSLIGTGQSAFNFQVLPPNPRPRLQPVHDVPLDQGGRVVLRWGASDFDGPAKRTITAYRVWRRTPQFALHAHPVAQPMSSGDAAYSGVPAHLNTDYWESLADQPAARLAGYGYTAATLNDSIAAGNPYTAYVIEALTSDPAVFYFSNIDSGYSVDNLPPAQPALLVATSTLSGVALHWPRSPEADFATFRVYRSMNAAFTPDPTTLIATANDTGFVDHANAAGTYKIVATDIHGNSSTPASVTVDRATATLVTRSSVDLVEGRVHLLWQIPTLPNSTWELERAAAGGPWTALAVLTAADDGTVTFDDDAVNAGERYAYRVRGSDGSQPFVSGELSMAIPAAELAIAMTGPNPHRRADLAVSFVLTSSATARIELFDVSGRLVEARDVSGMSPGRHELRLTAAGALRSGIHFIRLTQGPKTVLTRITVLN